MSEYLLPREAAAYLRTSPRRLQKLVTERKLAFVRDGRLNKFRKSDLDAYMAARIQPAKGGRS